MTDADQSKAESEFLDAARRLAHVRRWAAAGSSIADAYGLFDAKYVSLVLASPRPIHAPRPRILVVDPKVAAIQTIHAALNHILGVIDRLATPVPPQGETVAKAWDEVNRLGLQVAALEDGPIG